MNRLILIRHAKSDYPPGVADHDRPLSARGGANARQIADRLRVFLPAQARIGAAVSTAVRAQQTWHTVQGSLSIRSWNDRSLYLAEPTTILEVASAIEADVGIVVGHNPGLEELARSARGAEEAIDPGSDHRLMDKFPTSAFVVLDQPDGHWQRGDFSCVDFVVCR